MRYHIFMANMTLAQFKTQLLEMNSHLNYFPVSSHLTSVEKLPDDELVEILDRAKPAEWQRDVLTTNIDPYDMDLDAKCRYLEKLEAKHAIDKALRQHKAQAEKQQEKANGGTKRTRNGGPKLHGK
jgi:hypothetical protein